MSDAAALPIAELTALDDMPARDVASKEDRRFYIGLALATVFHSLLFAGFYGSPPRFIGDPSGDKDAINVAIVSEAELRSLSSARSTTPPGQPVPPTPPPAPAEAAAPPPPPPSEPAVQPADTAPAQPPTPPEAAVPEAALTLKPLEEPPTKTEAKPEPKPAAPPKTEPTPPTKQTKPERTKQARLDLSPPPLFSAPMSGGRGADLARPPGATRSGENDAFARGVVSALRKTMPQLSDATGRVTVRITLDRDGSLVSTQIVNPSNVRDLDRSVVFSTRQASFPFPPRNANAADLVFLITYIYH